MNGYVIDANNRVYAADRSGSVDLAARMDKHKEYYSRARDAFNVAMPLKIHRCTKRHNVGDIIDPEHE